MCKTHPETSTCSHQREAKGEHNHTSVLWQLPRVQSHCRSQQPQTRALESNEPPSCRTRRCLLPRMLPTFFRDHPLPPPGHSLHSLPQLRSRSFKPRVQKGHSQPRFFPSIAVPHLLSTSFCPPHPFRGYNLQPLEHHSHKSDKQGLQ